MERARIAGPRTLTARLAALLIGRGTHKIADTEAGPVFREKRRGQSHGIPWPGRGIARARHSNRKTGRRP